MAGLEKKALEAEKPADDKQETSGSALFELDDDYTDFADALDGDEPCAGEEETAVYYPVFELDQEQSNAEWCVWRKKERNTFLLNTR